MNSIIVIFPGTNRENDMAMAVERTSGKRPKFVWHDETELPETDLIIIPGGFSYGDYLRSGAMAARSAVMQAVSKKAKSGVSVLGVCNGFQILTEAGLLPGVLVRNRALKFICRNIDIRVEAANNVFTKHYVKGQILSIPVAHNDGSYFAEERILNDLESQDRIVFRYVDNTGKANFEGNPNGSINNIAGILNREKNILGLMPHPENATDPRIGSTDGQPLFESIVDALS